MESPLRTLFLGAAAMLVPHGASATQIPALTGPQVGEPAPPFSLVTLAGARVDLAAYTGKVLVINVWGTWCPPCRSETPELIAAAAKLRGQDVAFLGVDTTEEAPIVRAFVSARGIRYPQALDRRKAFGAAYDVQYFPTTYVIDGRGVLRARYVDVLGAAQIVSLVRSAKAGHNAETRSALQAKIDATLALPPQLAAASDAAGARAFAQAADSAIAASETLLEGSDAAHGRATDLLRTRSEEAALRDRAIAALEAVASAADDAFLARLRGDAARDRERYGQAVEAYSATLALVPNDPQALAGLAYAGGRLDRYDTVIAADTRLAALEPTDVGTLVDLARAQAKAGDATAAAATFEHAHVVARAALEGRPGDAKAIRMAAYARLYAGRTYAKAGDAPRARLEFDRMLALAQRLPANDARHDMYIEEGQEAIVALGLATAPTGTAVSLAPWTGAELPGSIPNTHKFRLVVAGPAGRDVALRTSGVPKNWVASFCTDRICAPNRTTVLLPSSGVKVIEFQLVPPHAGAVAPHVRVTSKDGMRESSATT